MNLQINKHEPDDLDLACDDIFEVMSKWETFKSYDDKIGVLEQIIDYLKMGKYTETQEEINGTN